MPSNPLVSIRITSVNSLLNSMPEENTNNICRKVVGISLFAEKQKTGLLFFIVNSFFPPHLRLIVKMKKKINQIFFSLPRN